MSEPTVDSAVPGGADLAEQSRGDGVAEPSPHPLLSMCGVSRRFKGPQGTVYALRDASLDLAAGQFVAVQGPSGCGKSTLLMIAGLLRRPDAGVVQLAGEQPFEFTPNDRSRFRASHIGFVFQQFHLIPFLSVLDNVLAAAIARLSEESSHRAQELCERFGLGDRLGHTPSQLSTGERQRVAMARALLNRPRLLLADEPTGNLDTASAETVLRDLRGYVDHGGAVLMVTHDDRAAAAADRSIQMDAGRLLE